MKYVFSLLALLALGATELRAVEQGGTTKIQIKISAVSHFQPLVKTEIVKTETLQETGPIPQDVTFDIPATKVLPVTNGAANWFTDHQFLKSLAEKGTWKAIKVIDKKRLASRKEACKEEYVWVHDNDNKKFRFSYNEIEQEDFIKSVVEQLGGELLVHKARNQRPGVPHQKCWCPFPKLSPEQMADLAERFNIKKVKNPKKNKAKKTNNNLLQQKNVQEKISQSQQSPHQNVTLNAEVFQQQQEIGHKNPATKVIPITYGAANWRTDYRFLESLEERGTWRTIEVIDKKRLASKKKKYKEKYVWVHDDQNKKSGSSYDESEKEFFINNVASFFGGDLLAHEAPNQSPEVPHQKCWCPFPKLSSEEMADLVERFNNKKKRAEILNNNLLQQKNVQEKISQPQQSPHQDVTLNAEERQQQQPSAMVCPANPQPLQQEIGHKNPVPKVIPITDRAFNWYTDYQFLDILAKRGTWITTEVIDKKRLPPKTEEYIWFHDNHYQRYGFCYNEIQKDDFIKSVISFFGGDLLAQEAPNQRPGVPLQKCWRPFPKLSPEQMEELVECFRNNKVNKSNDNQLKQEGEREKLGQSQQSPHQNVTLSAKEFQQQQYPYQSLSYPQSAPFMGYPANPQTFQQRCDPVIVLKLNHVGCPYKTYNNKDEQLQQQLLQQNSRLISILQTLTTPPTSKK